MKHFILVSLVLAACHSTTPPLAPATADLSPRRAQMLAWLHDYTEAGQFPTDANGHPLSVFRDARGVRCPMAELIFRSGRADLVDAVARTHNDLRLADVHDGPIYTWIAESGLTQDEVAMIQGAMTVDEMRGIQERAEIRTANVDAVKRANEWGQVKGHLATAEVALKIGAPRVREARR